MIQVELMDKQKGIIDKKYFKTLPLAESFIKQKNNQIMIDAYRGAYPIPEIRWQLTSEVLGGYGVDLQTL